MTTSALGQFWTFILKSNIRLTTYVLFISRQSVLSFSSYFWIYHNQSITYVLSTPHLSQFCLWVATFDLKIRLTLTTYRHASQSALSPVVTYQNYCFYFHTSAFSASLLACLAGAATAKAANMTAERIAKTFILQILRGSEILDV